MLCAVCDEVGEAAGATCPRCGGALLLHARFALERLLGSGGQSRVYAARDTQGGGEVAIKIMSLARVRDWKNVELFRRSAEVLRGLDHRGIPRLIDYFEEERPSAALYCLAHELIDGDTLAAAQKRGQRWDEASGRALLVELMEILGYLHGLSPPVIHRDIKPSNLMRARDGRLVLIDFDLVRDVMRPEGGATTTAGTAGYTPIEQYAGEAVPATDLYAAGATLAALLSRKEPLEMRRGGEQRLDVRAHIHVGAQLAAVLERMTEPEPARRYQSAAEVLAALRKPAAAPTPPATSGSTSRAGALAAMAGVVVLVGVGGFLVLMGGRPTPVSTPVPLSVPAAAQTPKPPPPPPVASKPTRAKPTPPRLATNLHPAEVRAALLAGDWDGRIDGGARVQLHFSQQRNKLRGQLTTFEVSGNGRTLTALSVEIAELGTVTLTGRAHEDGVAVMHTWYGDLTDGLTGLVGTRETQYESSGSTYVTTHPWSAQRK